MPQFANNIVTRSRILPLQGLYRDWEAVENALLFTSSQGQVEGQVHRLKLFKRQGYGRASPTLLQARLVGARNLYRK